MNESEFSSLVINKDATLTMLGQLTVGELYTGHETSSKPISTLHLYGGMKVLGFAHLSGLTYMHGTSLEIAQTLDLHWSGKVFLEGGTVQAAGYSVALAASFSKTAASYEIFTRILFEGGQQDNLALQIDKIEIGTSGTNKVVNASDIVADADHVGNYRVYVDGNDLKVDYVGARKGGAVPEPSTATLGLLTLSALFLRRKRA